MALGDANLLFGTVAVQLRLVTPQQLATAASVWAAAPGRTIADILVEHGVLRAEDRRLIDQLIYRQTEATGGDAGQVLEFYGGAPVAHESFGGALLATPGKADSPYASLRVPGGTDSLAADAAAAEPTTELTPEAPGRYTVESEQGRGGVGRVLIAFDSHIQRQVALKELLPSEGSAAGLSASPQRMSAAQRERFLREARITGQLEHPGIVPVHELGQRADGTVYYTMKLVRGTTLADKLRAATGLPERMELLPHFLDLCHAIAYAHSRGVVHRDIKPANVMVGEFGETVLLDWGLAKVQGQQDEGADKLADEVRLLKQAGAGESVAGTPIGTPSYMPPEQADGRIADIDERSDVWSLGAALYEILTGQPPFRGANAYEVIGAVLTDEAAVPTKLQPDVPAELSAVAMRCLRRAPHERYQSVDQLAADIAAFQTGGLVGAYSYSTGKMLRRWAARRWPALLTAAIALVVLAVVGSLSYTQVVAQRNTAVAAMTRLDRTNNELLGLKLAHESHSQLLLGQSERAALLALQAARYFGKSSPWMPEIAPALREVLSSDELSRVLLGHKSAVRGVSFSPDGRWLATASFGGRGDVRVWDLRKPGSEPRVLAGSAPVVFSPDSKQLISGIYGIEAPSFFQTWNPAEPTSAPRRFVQREDPPSCLAFSPDGQWLATADTSRAGEIQLWRAGSLDKATAVVKGGAGMVLSLSFSPDSRQLAIGSFEPVIRIVKLAHLTERPLDLKGTPALQHTNNIYGLAFSVDGSKLYSASRDGKVLEWQLEAGGGTPSRALLDDGNFVMAVALRPDGRQLAAVTFDDKSVWLINLAGDPTPRRMAGHTNPPWSAAYSPDGRMLATGAEDNTVRLWNLLAADPEPIKLASTQTTSAVLTSDGATLICGGFDPPLQQRDMVTPDGVAEIHGASDSVRRLALSQDERYLAVATNQDVVVWDWPSAGKPRRRSMPWTVRAVAFSPDSAKLIVACEMPTDVPYKLQIYNPADLTKEVGSIAAPGAPYALAVSPDGRLLASANGGQGARVWQFADLEQTWRSYTLDEPAVALAFSADSQHLAVCSWDKKVHVWNVGAQSSADSPEEYILSGHESWVQCAAFSPNGKLLASGSRDNTVRLWNLETPTARPEILVGHTDSVRFVGFSADGQRLISASLDGSVRLWEVSSQALVQRAQALPWRNLSKDEWHDLVGAEVPYERTLPDLLDGEGFAGN